MKVQHHYLVMKYWILRNMIDSSRDGNKMSRQLAYKVLIFVVNNST